MIKRSLGKAGVRGHHEQKSVQPDLTDIDMDNYVDFHQCSCRKYVAQRTHDALIIHAYVGNLLVKNLDFFYSTTECSKEHVENML